MMRGTKQHRLVLQRRSGLPALQNALGHIAGLIHLVADSDELRPVRNHRSTQSILEAARGVIDLVTERFTKNLWTDRNST